MLKSSNDILLLRLLNYLKTEDDGGSSSGGSNSGNNNNNNGVKRIDSMRISSSNSMNSGFGGGGGGGANNASNNNNKNQTLGFQFRSQLKELMYNISLTTPHYIRCIKPNSTNRANVYDSKLILSQLKCCGVIEAIRVSRAGYPNRYLFNDFLQRYHGLLYLFSKQYLLFTNLQHWLQQRSSHMKMKRSAVSNPNYSGNLGTNTDEDDPREITIAFCQQIAFTILSNPAFQIPVNLQDHYQIFLSQCHNHHHHSTNHTTSGFSSTQQINDLLMYTGLQIGITMIFLRRNTFDVLELLRFSLQREKIIIIQSMIRCKQQYYKFNKQRKSCIKLQWKIRQYLAYLQYQYLKQIQASIIIQTRFRTFTIQKKYYYYMACIIRIQCKYRSYQAYQIMKRLKQHAKQMIIAKYYRKYVQQQIYQKYRSAVSTLQRKFRIIQAKKLLIELKIEARSLKKVC
jgi:myosin heavy subunit